MSNLPEISGTADRGYEAVLEAFKANFRHENEVGAAVCLYRNGKAVVDLWGGIADVQSGERWRADTLGVLASPTKALTTGVVLMLVDQGVLDLDSPLTTYWPEFGQNGKGSITLRMVLSHRSGVVCLDHDPLSMRKLREHFPVVRALEAAVPEWDPGTSCGYHATTFGPILSEVVRRVTGCTVGEYFSTTIANPLGLDAFLGLKGRKAHLAAMIESKAEELMSGSDPGEIEELRDSSSLTYRATLGSMSPEPADPHVEDASYGGLASAHALARYMASLINSVEGVRLVGEDTLDLARQVASTETCLVMHTPVVWGLGFQLPDSDVFPADAGLKTAFGLSGANGVFLFADPTYDIAFGYIPNAGSEVMGSMDNRVRALVEATYRSVDSTTSLG